MNRRPYYTRAVIICHGLSEVIFTQSIKSNLKLPIEISSKDNGKCSIQLTSILKYLNTQPFNSIKGLINKYKNIEIKN